MTSRYMPGRAGGSPDTAEVAALLELSDERDRWQLASLDRERAAYLAGYRDGRADALREASDHKRAA